MQRRSRMISFRVSDQQFEAFRDFCRARGNSSVSDLARTALRQLVEAETTTGNHLHDRIGAIELEVKRLTGIVGRDPLIRPGVAPVSIGSAMRRLAGQ